MIMNSRTIPACGVGIDGLQRDNRKTTSDRSSSGEHLWIGEMPTPDHQCTHKAVIDGAALDDETVEDSPGFIILPTHPRPTERTTT